MAAAAPAAVSADALVHRLVARVDEGVKILTVTFSPAANAASAEDVVDMIGADDGCLGDEKFGKGSFPGPFELSPKRLSRLPTVAVAGPSGVGLFDATTGKHLKTLPMMGAPNALYFSPQGTYLLAHKRPTPGRDRSEGPEKNLVLFDIASGEPVFEMFQKSFSSETWPTLRFDNQEKYLTKMVTNEVHFYEIAKHKSSKLAAPDFKLRSTGLAGFFIDPNGEYVGMYKPEVKGAPAFAAIFRIEDVQQNGDSAQSTARKSFFNCSSCDMTWSPKGGNVLILVTADVDRTNRNYYGSQQLYYLSANGSVEQRVELAKEGPVYDFEWNPRGDSFIVVYGTMPAKATLYDGKTCQPKFDFGVGPRNMVKINAFGRFSMVAGFGNLPGDVELWDVNKLKKISHTKVELGVSAEWSPDGRFLCFSTTAPRMRVDNSVRILKFNGILLSTQPFAVLYQAAWVPVQYIKDQSGALVNPYPDRHPLPPEISAAVNIMGGKGQNGAPQKKEAYRPPSARGRETQSVSMKSLSLRDDASDLGPRKIKSGAGFSGGQLPPGASEAESKSAAKNRKRREAAARKKAAEVEVTKATTANPTSPTGDGGGGNEESADAEKKLRNLRKKLRQIEQLQDRAGSELTPEQVAKISAKASLEAEIAALTASLPSS